MRGRRKTFYLGASFSVTPGDRTYVSRVDLDNEQFYKLMAQCNEIPKAAQIAPFQFQEIYLREAQSGVTDLILVLINSQDSAAYNNSFIDLFYEEYPEYRAVFHVHCFDGAGYEPAAAYPIGAAVASNSGPKIVGAAFTRKREAGR